MENKIAVSACMIVKNEEAMIEDCLKSLRGAVSEIILVDTGSTDRTIEIARRYNCKIYRTNWKNDFSEARNISLSYATGTHILIIDADERLVNPTALVQFLQSRASDEGRYADIGGWLIKVVSRARRVDGGTDVYITNLLRLFRNYPDVRFDGIIHEQVVESIITHGWKIENSPLEINHLGYSFGVEKMKQKQYRNLELLNIAIEKNPQDAYNLYNRAKTYLSLRQPEKAEADTERVLEIADKGGSVRPQALNYGGITAAQLGKYSIAIERAKESLSLVPNQGFAHFILGESYMHLGQFEEALNEYRIMGEQQKHPSLESFIVGEYYLPPEQVRYKIGKCLLGLNRPDEAEKMFSDENADSFLGLAQVEFRRKNYEKTREYLARAKKEEPERAELIRYIKQFDDSMEMLELRRERAKAETKISFDDKTIRTATHLPKGNIVSDCEINHALKPVLSVSMIVKNEEKFLPDCLESIREIADEIIIVDTGSTDRTKEIAASFGAKIFDFEWCDDFSAARNEALKHCNGEWILYLDADERLKNSDAVRKCIYSPANNVVAYICTIVSLHLSAEDKAELHRGGYPRLFKNLGFPKICFQGRVHEQITPSLFASGGAVEFSDVIIRHLGYDASREVMEEKIKRNYSMLIAHVKEEPTNAYAWFQLGQTLSQMKLFKQAEDAIQMSIDLGELSAPVLASATATLAQIVGARGDINGALALAERSLKAVPQQVFALFLKGCALLKLEKKSEALPIFREVRERNVLTRGVPRTGFDIALSDEIITNAIEKCEEGR